MVYQVRTANTGPTTVMIRSVAVAVPYARKLKSATAHGCFALDVERPLRKAAGLFVGAH